MAGNDVNSLLAGFFNSQAKGNQLLLNIIDQLIRQATISETNYQNSLKEINKHMDKYKDKLKDPKKK